MKDGMAQKQITRGDRVHDRAGVVHPPHQQRPQNGSKKKDDPHDDVEDENVACGVKLRRKIPAAKRDRGSRERTRVRVG